MRCAAWRRQACRVVVAAALACTLALPAWAAVTMDRTRLIVTEKDREATVQLTNEEISWPVMLQMWVADEASDGSLDVNMRPTPFLATPPQLRLESKKSQAIRVFLTQPASTLPADRESVYWLNVLEVPARPSDPEAAAIMDDPNYMQVGFVVSLKLFYRPQRLIDYSLGDGDRLRFALQRDDAGQSWLLIRNPAPLHQSLASLALNTGSGEPIEFDSQTLPMVAPFNQTRIALPAVSGASVNPAAPSAPKVAFSLINDDGNRTKEEERALESAAGW